MLNRDSISEVKSPELRAQAFSLANAAAYALWREEKLTQFPSGIDELTVTVADMAAPTAAELAALRDGLKRANLVRYRTLKPTEDRSAVLAFGQALGLGRTDLHLCADEDGVSALEVRTDSAAGAGEYIPYTEKPLSWHCDGYYNTPEDRVHAMLLHCVRPAQEGGENALLDHEMLYIALRDRDPAFIEALMHPEALAIPANVVAGEEIRPERVGPVFSVDSRTGALHMRYTARRKSIRWRDDATTTAAVKAIEALLVDPESPVFRCRLAANEGLLAHNILHNRTGFVDPPEQPGRLIFRARYVSRVPLT